MYQLYACGVEKETAKCMARKQGWKKPLSKVPVMKSYTKGHYSHVYRLLVVVT